jgi:hypothetical protein
MRSIFARYLRNTDQIIQRQKFESDRSGHGKRPWLNTLVPSVALVIFKKGAWDASCCLDINWDNFQYHRLYSVEYCEFKSPGWLCNKSSDVSQASFKASCQNWERETPEQKAPSTTSTILA